MLTSVKRLLLLHATIHAKLHMLLLTMSNFLQQIITCTKFRFKFHYSFGPTHARKIGWQYMLLCSSLNIFNYHFKAKA